MENLENLLSELEKLEKKGYTDFKIPTMDINFNVKSLIFDLKNVIFDEK